MKVVIHAGIHRTGSTSLQHFLEENRSRLITQGIAYPGETRNQQSIAWSLKRGESGAKEIRSLIHSMGEAETLVLSAEDFCILTDLQWLEEISRDHETRVVFYLRRQDHWLMSWYNQHVKWPFDRLKSQMGTSEFLDTIGDFHWLDYAVLLERWAAVLGEANVSIGVIEAGQVEDVIEDFVGRLGIAREGLDFDIKRVNPSLPVHVLEIARHLGAFDLPTKARIQLISVLRTGLAHKAQPVKAIYSPEDRMGILDRFESSNQAVARRVFGRDSLFLEPRPAPDDPFYSFPDISRQELMREWIAPVIKLLLAKL